MGKGHRQRPIVNEKRWDVEYQRIFGDENERKEKRRKVHGEGDGEEAAQAEGHDVRVAPDATSEGPQG